MIDPFVFQSFVRVVFKHQFPSFQIFPSLYRMGFPFHVYRFCMLVQISFFYIFIFISEYLFFHYYHLANLRILIDLIYTLT